MTAAALLLDRARADGVNIHLGTDGKIKVRGNESAVARLLPDVRDHKPALVALLTEPRHEWRVVLPTGETFTASCTPPTTLAEMTAWYPGADIRPEPEEAPAAVPAIVVDPPPVQQAPLPAMVACAECRHYQPDPRNFGGLGQCLTAAPASLKPGSLWPASVLRCAAFAPMEGHRHV